MAESNQTNIVAILNGIIGRAQTSTINIGDDLGHFISARDLHLLIDLVEQPNIKTPTAINHGAVVDSLTAELKLLDLEISNVSTTINAASSSERTELNEKKQALISKRAKSIKLLKEYSS